MKRRYKVLLVQLPAPEYNFRKHWGNAPLAAAYLKAMAHKESLLNHVDIEILNNQDADLSGDARLLDAILSRSPDMVGFSLYVWNLLRSLHIAKAIKQHTPRTKIIVGGPEVSRDNLYIQRHPAVDFGCFGEGEIPFTQILINILNGCSNFSKVQSIFFKISGHPIITSQGMPLKDLDQIPSPFALGYINPRQFPVLTYESIRGCSFQCNYCVTGSLQMRFFSTDRILSDMKIIYKSGPRLIRFIDSDFALHPHFHEICKKLKRINRKKTLRFIMFLHEANITPAKIQKLSGINVKTLEIGLQTINSRTLQIVGRPSIIKEMFIKGLSLLEKKKINYVLDLIIGLPEETLDDIKRTVHFLKINKISKEHLTLFLLSLLPGTRLRREASQHGITYQKSPPYLLTFSKNISAREIEKVRGLFGKKYAPNPETVLISHCDSCFSKPKDFEEGPDFLASTIHRGINKVIWAFDTFYQNASNINAASQKLSRYVDQPFTLWLKTQNVIRDSRLIKAAITPIVSANPFLIWNVVLETPRSMVFNSVQMIKTMVKTKETDFSELIRVKKALQIYVLSPWTERIHTQKSARGHNDPDFWFYWLYSISSKENWRSGIKKLVRERSADGIVLDFKPEVSPKLVISVLEFLNKWPKNISRKIFYKNYAVRLLQQFLFEKGNRRLNLLQDTLWRNQSILMLDKSLRFNNAILSKGQAVADIVRCQLMFPKFAKKHFQ